MPKYIVTNSQIDRIAENLKEQSKIDLTKVDYKNLKTIYIKLNSWLLPETEDVDFDSIISKTTRKIKLRI